MLPLLAGCGPEAQPDATVYLVDHQHLRRVDDGYAADLAAIGVATAAAQERGIDGYVLFSRGFEDVLNYDFPGPDGEPIGPRVWGPEDERWGESAAYRAAVGQAAELARQAGLTPVYHTNQFDLPDEVAEVLQRDGRPLLCADDPATWDLYARKIDEFFRLLPEFAGLQVTADEAEHPVWRCSEGKEVADDPEPEAVTAAVHRLIEETARALPPEKVLEVRAWGRVGAMSDPGDLSADLAHGGSAYAFRFNWSDGGNPLFERPWGNVANLEVALAMIREGRDHRAALVDWVAATYPPDAHDAALALYLASADIQRRLTSLGPVETTDHSRLFREHTSHGVEERVADSLDRLQSAGLLTTLEAFDARRQEIDAAVAEGRDLVEALPVSVDPAWRRGLLTGLAAESWMAQGTTDQLEMLYLMRRPSLAGAADRWAALDARIEDRDVAWQAADPESFQALNGDEARAMYVKLAPDVGHQAGEGDE